MGKAVPIVRISAQDYSSMIESGYALVRLQSLVVGIIRPVAGIPFERGSSNKEIIDKFQESGESDND